jgi:hypothetical protein
MAGDLFLPIMFIVMMYIIIGCIEDGLTLLAIGFLFFPIAFMFAETVNSGGYTLLFGATLVSGSVGNTLIVGSMFMIPLFSVAKIMYVRNVLRRSEKHD